MERGGWRGRSEVVIVRGGRIGRVEGVVVVVVGVHLSRDLCQSLVQKIYIQKKYIRDGGDNND